MCVVVWMIITFIFWSKKLETASNIVVVGVVLFRLQFLRERNEKFCAGFFFFVVGYMMWKGMNVWVPYKQHTLFLFYFYFFHANKNWLIKNNGGIEEAHTMHYYSIIVSDPMCIFSWSNCERFGPRFSGLCFMGKNEYQNKILTAWQCFLSVRRRDRQIQIPLSLSIIFFFLGLAIFITFLCLQVYHIGV